eukprot:COSAG06_NODE_2551_length_6684_cov_3.568565_5_plen_767_part_00
MVRAVKEETDADLWATLCKEHPDLLLDVPTPGRQIKWESLDKAEYPLFGARRRAHRGGGGQVDDTFALEEVEVDADAQRRLLAGFERERRAEEERAQRRRQVEVRRAEQQRQAQARERTRIAEERARIEEEEEQYAKRRRWNSCVILSMIIVAVSMVVGTTQIMAHLPPNDILLLTPEPEPEPEPEPPSEPEPEPALPFECNWACSALDLVPKVELAIGAALHVCTQHHAFLFSNRILGFRPEEFFTLSVLSGVAAFWHASIEAQDLITSGIVLAWGVLPWLGGIPSALWLLFQVYGLYQVVYGPRGLISNRHEIMAMWCLAPIAHVAMFYTLTAVARAKLNLDHLEREPRTPLEYQCDWVSRALWLVPLAELCVCVGCYVIFLLCFMCKDDLPRYAERRRDFMRAGPWSACCGLIMLTLPFCAMCSVAHWPVLVWWLSPDSFMQGHIIVSYIMAPSCSGALAPFIALLALQCGYEYGLLRMEDSYFSCVAAVSLLQFISYAVGVIYVRNWMSEPAVVHFECTWPCMALRGAAIASLVIAVSSSGALIRKWRSQRRDYRGLLHTNDRCAAYVAEIVSNIACFLIVGLCFGLPVLLSLLRPQTLVTGSAFWVYLLIPAIFTLSLGGASAVCFRGRRVLAVSTHGRRVLTELPDYNKEVCIPSAIAVLSGTATVWLLWILRQTADPSFAQPLSKSVQKDTIVVWVTIAVNWLGLLLLLVRRAHLLECNFDIVCPTAIFYLVMVVAVDWPVCGTVAIEFCPSLCWVRRT